jgi:SAM-dependent methyltransferase
VILTVSAIQNGAAGDTKMATSMSEIQNSRDDARLAPIDGSSHRPRPNPTIGRILRRSASKVADSRLKLVSIEHGKAPKGPINGTSASGYLSKAIALCRRVKRQLAHVRNEMRQFACEAPQYAGSGRIGEIVPPIAGTRLRTNVGSPSLQGYLFVADAWHSVVSRLLAENSRVLDIGCGCGKTARTLVYHPYIKTYIGFDVIRENVDWSEQSIAPQSKGRFQFHFLDVYSEAYNPAGELRGTDVVFPAGDGTIDFAFAASVFTHLLEADAKHYLREVSRTLAPDGVFLPSIHTSPAPGSTYSGNECRIDVDSEYFIGLAEAAGLRLVERLGALCGQDTFLFKRRLKSESATD